MGRWSLLAFTLWPLAQAQEAPVSRLFRDALEENRRRPPLLYLGLCALAVAGLAALAILTAEDKRAAAIFLAAAAGVFILLRGVALLLMALARRLPKPRATMARLALANVHRPGALTPTVVLSLGLGLSLLTAIALIDRSLTEEIGGSLAERAPSFFFVDVPSADEADFFPLPRPARGRAAISVRAHAARAHRRSQRHAGRAGQALGRRGLGASSDRGISFSQDVPEGSTLVEGDWWGRRRARRWCRSRRSSPKGWPQDRRQRHRQCARPRDHAASPICGR